MLSKIKNYFKSITGLLIITVFATSLVPAILNYLFDFYLTYKNSINVAKTDIQQISYDIKNFYKNFINESKSILQSVNEYNNWNNLKEIERHISIIQKVFYDKNFHHVFIIDKNGNIIISPEYNDHSHLNQKIDLNNINFNDKDYILTNFKSFEESGHYHPLLLIPAKDTDYYIGAEINLDILKNFIVSDYKNTYICDKVNNCINIQQDKISLEETFKNHEIFNDLNRFESDTLHCNFYKNHLQQNVYACFYKASEFGFTIISEITNEKIFSLVKLQIIRSTIVFLLLGIIILYLLFKISRRFSLPLNKISDGIEEMEKERGLILALDATTGIKETDQLVSKFNKLLEKINLLIQDIRTTSDNIDKLFVILKNSSQTIENASVDISSILEENSASLQEINTNMEDIENLGKKNYENAKEIQDLIQTNLTKLNELGKNLENLAEVSQSTASFTKESKSQSEQLKNMIYGIQETSERISEILNIIKEISDRTNLLSLNASIEAARAGESGKGFAVVAQSISNLAETTEKSVQDIEELIEQTTNQMNQAIQYIDKSSEMMNKSYDMVSSLDKEIQNSKVIIKSQLERSNKIFDNTNKMASIATDTFNSIKFIKNIIVEIHKSIDDASRLSIQFTEISRKLAEAITNLDQDAQKLKRQIKRFSSK